MKKKVFLPILLFIFLSAAGQYNNPEPGVVFNDSSIPRIDVEIKQEFLDLILMEGNEAGDEEYLSKVTFSSQEVTKVLDSVGFRLRGNTSRYSAKKSFKVSINAFEKGRDYKGLEKWNLNGEHNDPSIIRSKIAWDLMLQAGAVSARSNHFELYVNGEYKGLYIHVEHIDEEFVEERFGNKDGNLYKCLWPADLNYLGADPDLYKFDNFGRRAYELKRNEELDDYSDLAHFIDILNNTPNSTFQEEIEKVFDVESYLRALAVEVLVGHWDNYGFNQNNYYLYHNTADEKFYYIPYDLDNTFGVDWFDIRADQNVFIWFDPASHRPLTRRIIEVQEYRDRFSQIMRSILTNYFNPSRMSEVIDQTKSKIQSSAERDEYRTLDYEFTIDDFNRSFDEKLDLEHIRYGLKEYITIRYHSALEQIGEEEPLGLISTVDVYPNPVNQILYLGISEQLKHYEALIINASGHKVYQQTIYENSIRIPPFLSNGLYFLLLKGQDQKILKSKFLISN